MPDVARSDSQRSDTSLKPRVSFNRDVHVKRIVPRENIVATINGNGPNHNVISPVRKERIKKSKKQLEEEAAQVIYQRNQIDRGVVPEKYYTLPSRNKSLVNYPNASLDRKSKRRSSVDLVNNIAPKKPPRTFTTTVNKPQQQQQQQQQKASIFDLFKRSTKKSDAKKSNLRRTVSDVTNLKIKRDKLQNNISNEKNFRKHYGSDSEENLNNTRQSRHKKLSPIVEITQREDYFAEVNGNDNNKENNSNNENVNTGSNRKESVTEKLKEYIDEVDEALYKETGIRVSPVDKEEKKVEVVLIDLDKAEKISNNNSKKTKFKKNTIGKIKSIAINNSKKTNKENDNNNKYKNKSNVGKQKPVEQPKKLDEKPTPARRIKRTIETLENQPKNSPTMIHSSQKPAEKLPLTKGRTVDNIIKRLSNDSSSPPPKTNLLISPNISIQHNNNQPFSYTRGLSPEKCMSNENLPNPIIYAQVVCANGNSGPSKQTVHTAFTNGRKHPHSDSDEGLGYEENTGGVTRKYESEINNKSVTYFGDENYKSQQTTSSRQRKTYDNNNTVYLNNAPDNKFDEEESPITPKFTNPGYIKGFFDYDRKYNEIIKTEQNGYIDSSLFRGRGDGMDSKRRESLSEQFENDFDQGDLHGCKTINGRSDLSARRDLLESRMNRRLNDKIINHPPNANSTPTKPYRTTENYETQINRHINEQLSLSPKNRYKKNDFINNSYDNEPKSFDSQLSDYRSSPENKHFETSHNKSNNKYNNKRDTSSQKIFKNRDLYKSTPEIHNRTYDEQIYCKDSYHDSLRREKTDNRTKSFIKYKNDRYIDHNERKDKFGDSGIENDIRRDSGEHRPTKSRRDYFNDSEDEGFASSLLIASERQHTEDNINQKKNRDYDSDRPYSREDDPYNHLEQMNYKNSRFEYTPRERSIDDGSHFDPRIDKEFDKNKGAFKKVEKKPPKPEKKRGLEKVKQLFSRDTKKKKEKQEMVPEESLRARYTEYKGSNENLEPKVRSKEVNELNRSYDYSNRKRLPTPSPSPTREIQPNPRRKSEVTHSWFKSLDRLSRKKTKKDTKDTNFTNNEEVFIKSNPPKNLRFFGDTDIESNDSVRQKSSTKSRPGIVNRERIKSQSSRDLHNISEEFPPPELKNRNTGYKSMMNIFESDRNVNKNPRTNLKPPMSPTAKNNRENSRSREERGRRRKNEVSSVESSTEGDSSQQSQRSIVYLHAATVGDIPGPAHLRSGRKAASREELISNDSNRIQPQVKTLSRSFSVLAPWRPRHYRDEIDIDYTQYPKPTKNGKYEQKISKNGSSRKENVSTLKKKAQETRRSNQNMSTLSRKSRSKENMSTLKRSKDDLSKDSSSTLYKKKDKLPRENSRYSKDRDDKRMSSKCLSVEYLGTNGRQSKKSKEHNRDISRSVSMPKDPEKTAGWFKMNKKSKKSVSTQRL